MLPPDFIAQMRGLLGGECSAFIEAMSANPQVSIRYNTLKLAAKDIPHAERIAWCEDGRYIELRPDFTNDPLLHAGAYYVQDASSMIIGHAVQQLFNTPICALDLCAAPGGKTTLLAQALPQTSIIVANEIIAHRAAILAENVTKWGSPNILVTNNDPQAFAHVPAMFDLLFIDAPCSGEGMFRKDINAQQQWNSSIVKLCAARQRRIVADAWSALKEGGILIYSTCTFNTAENEENAAWIAQRLGGESILLHFDKKWGIAPTADLDCAPFGGIYGYRCMPHRVRGEGFFITALRKTSEGNKMRSSFSKKKEKCRYAVVIKGWMRNANICFEQQGDDIYAFIPDADIYEALRQRLRFVLLPQRVACVKGGALQPQIALALSTLYNVSAFHLADLPLDEALAYLRCEPPIYRRLTANHFATAAYSGLPLGFMRILVDRCNNLYPRQWRIRK